MEGVDTLDACPLYSRNAVRNEKFFILTFAPNIPDSWMHNSKTLAGVVQHISNTVSKALYEVAYEEIFFSSSSSITMFTRLQI